ncbi:MAG: NAD(P)/FAD-dependent oxidoreductase [Deltaproteobacteria bacterium]|nr:NAD(P)/FAD-dependent oxidoreductase [Deltaproteobacteria bacterium]
MSPNKYDVVIVGSGLAGIVAANRLADYNLEVLLLDENIHIGGQILRRIPQNLGVGAGREPSQVRRIGFRFIESVKEKKIRVMNRTKVLGIQPEGELLIEEDEKRAYTITADIILFATGARERFLPFKGWMLPGVLSTGAVQILIKGSGVLPAKEILIAGSGPFLYAVAYEFVINKGTVLSVLEQTMLLDNISLIGRLLYQFPKFPEGLRYLAKLLISGVPIRYGTQLIEARGDTGLTEVVAARVDRSGRVREGTEKVFKTRALAVGHGFVPNIELPQLAGCELEYSQDKGGWVVRVKDDLETSIERVYAAGEITGIGGALKSITEGNLSAMGILHNLGKVSENEYISHLQRLSKERRHHLAFGKCLNTLYKIPHGAIRSIPDETVICRCEGVRMGDIQKAIANGYDTPGALKRILRVGMGTCQGRICGPVLYDILSAYREIPAHDIPPFSVRVPVKAVSCGSLIS